MARRPRLQGPNSVHHVIVRGNERQNVFRDDLDRQDYLNRLRRYRDRFEIRLYAYCLMTNHVHLAVEEGPLPLSRFMHALQSSYTQYFNKRHGRVGHLFQGRFKSFIVDGDRYLQALLRYIHENPVAAGIVDECEKYRWSSDRFFRTGRAPRWMDLDRALEMIGPTRALALRRYRSLMGDPSFGTYENVIAHGGAVKGDEAFAKRILERSPTPPLRTPGWSAERLAVAVASARGVPLSDLTGPSRRRELSQSRIIAAYLGRFCLGIPVAESARFFGRDPSALARGVALFFGRLERDPEIRAWVARMVRGLETPRRSRANNGEMRA
ncbi:MAG: transposase [Acidobacteriota bacterium]